MAALSLGREFFLFCYKIIWYAVVVSGYEVRDYGDLKFEQFSDDPPAHNVKNPRSVGSAVKKVCLCIKFLFCCALCPTECLLDSSQSTLQDLTGFSWICVYQFPLKLHWDMGYNISRLCVIRGLCWDEAIVFRKSSFIKTVHSKVMKAKSHIILPTKVHFQRKLNILEYFAWYSNLQFSSRMLLSEITRTRRARTKMGYYVIDEIYSHLG